MGNVISSDDLDQILAGLAPHDAGRRRTGDAIPYDFRRPGKFAKDQLRTFTMLHEIFARLMTSFFAAHLRTRVQMGVSFVEQQTYRDFIQNLPNPTVLGTFQMPPLPGICLVHLSNELALSIVDRVFGGAVALDQPQRALTDIEQSVVRRVLVHAMGSLQEAWHRVVDVRPHLEAMEVNPLFIQVAMMPTEMLAIITLGVDIGQRRGEFTLALPFTTVEPILALLSPQSWFASAREHLPEQARELRRRIETAPVQVTAQLGQAHLSVDAFLRLGENSVVVLDQRVGDEVALYVDNQLAFYGRPGVAGRRMVVAIRRQAATTRGCGDPPPGRNDPRLSGGRGCTSC